MKDTIKKLWEEANKKRNGETTNITWTLNEGTSGKPYIYTTLQNITCYMYLNKKGKYSTPTFSLITKKYPYGSPEIGYKEALSLL